MNSFLRFTTAVLLFACSTAQAKSVGDLGGLVIGPYQSNATGTLTGPYVSGTSLPFTQTYRNTSGRRQDSLAFTVQVFGPGYAQTLSTFFGRLRGLSPNGGQDDYVLGNVELPGPGSYLVQTAAYVYDRTTKDWVSGPVRTYWLFPVTPLPVELVNFTATAAPDSVSLHWQTASERKCFGFWTEHSLDARTWLPGTFIGGNGNAATAHFYQAREKLLTGRTYYRLRQLDTDGTQHYSPVVVVAPAQAAGVVVYPNPAHDQAHVSASPGAPAKLYDSSGRLSRQQQLDTTGRLDLRGLPAGSYQLVVGEGRAAKRTQLVTY